MFDSQIRPRYRGRGLGKLLYEKAIEVAREQGFQWFLAGTYTSPDARNVWNSLKKRHHVEDEKEFATGFTPATHRPGMYGRPGRSTPGEPQKIVNTDLKCSTPGCTPYWSTRGSGAEKKFYTTVKRGFNPARFPTLQRDAQLYQDKGTALCIALNSRTFLFFGIAPS